MIRTIDINETAEYILRMCDKFHHKEKSIHFMNLEHEHKMEKIRGCYKKREKKNITPENIGEIILSQISSA